ncbi:hypothetical protein [Riemerella columbipharyngis]|uniref:Lipoprotein n=1 Tax=Riemerella columbipharyngis TaxID=1071918 RepID=A0A1G7A8F9_9FLAO|nr:hypothetical protein [Riemerella columbipharyngis]SDE10757.1 hypothetical protein SAMN05421544_10381 [Riemerella columbipharyngis]
MLKKYHPLTLILLCLVSVISCSKPLYSYQNNIPYRTDRPQQYKYLPLKKYLCSPLPYKLRESSGLTIFHQQLFSFNDSGNASDLFVINTENNTLETIKTNADNNDWEAISAKNDTLYIGDFGNNLGNRKDLAIYVFPYQQGESWHYSKKIPFYYPTQKDFTPRNINHNYDMEAMVIHQNAVQLFSKEWKSYDVTHYELSLNKTNNRPATVLEKYHLGYAATGAAYHDSSLYIVGYTKLGAMYLSIFKESSPNRFFKNKPQKFYLGSALSIGQIEGIAASEKGLFLSCEKFRTIPASLYFIPYIQLK